MTDITTRILEAINRPSYTPLKPKTLAARMNISDPEEYAAFRRALRVLIRDQRIVVGRGSTLRAADAYGAVVGTFRRTSSGHAFVRPHQVTGETGSEIRVRPGRELDASTGDEVMIKITRRASKTMTASGDIVRIQARATRTFVGTYFERDGAAHVRVDGTVFAHSILVGDPGAKGAKPQDKVVVEVLKFPSTDDRGEGVITEVLGPLGQPGVDVITIIRAFGLPEEFPENVLEEARVEADKFREDDLVGREDFTKEIIITIDPTDARDFDDAVSLIIDPKTKNWQLGVHIADVAHFARPGGALDSEARKRATSIYLPQRVIPMFPEVVSNGLASLQQSKLRYVKTVRMEFTESGQKGHVSFHNAAIRVKRRFSYDQVSEILKDFAAAERSGSFEPEVLQLLIKMRGLAAILHKKRLKRGSLELSMPEAVLEFDELGRVNGAHFAVHDESHQMIEEFMLAANEAVAEHFSQLEVPFLRRVHPAPNEEKLNQFASFAELLGYPLERAEDRFELQRVLHETIDKPERAAIHYAMLRSLKQATYSPIQDEHYALASRDYCHFTSPIRRYPDLVVHRLLDRWIKTGRAAADVNELRVLGDHCSKMERRAETAERELTKLKILQYLSSRLGDKMDAVITGVADYGFFAQAENIPAEGLVHISSLMNDFFRFDEDHRSLIGSRTKVRYRLGDRVRVEVARVDLQRRMLDFRLAPEGPTPRPEMSEPSRGRRLNDDVPRPKGKKGSKGPKDKKKGKKKKKR